MTKSLIKKSLIKKYNNINSVCFVFLLWIVVVPDSYSMGLRSFVALPVEKSGAVFRFTLESDKNTDTNTLISSIAYGVSAKQAILLGLPYRLSPTKGRRQGDLSALLRQTVWQIDTVEGTDRIAWLGGVIVPTESNRDAAIQGGFVFTHFKNRHELDVDALYQVGMGDRTDSGRYDISWQYRLSPRVYPEWGLSNAINSVLELNGRWVQGHETTHQFTMGLQWIHPKVVLEGGVVKDINNNKETRYIFSTRFHF